MRMNDGLMVTVSAPDYSTAPPRTEINGHKGRAIIEAKGITLEYWTGETEQWPPHKDSDSGMDRAVSEIVAYLDDRVPFSYNPEEAVHTLEAIVAFHASHKQNAAYVNLPLSGSDREIVVLSG